MSDLKNIEEFIGKIDREALIAGVAEKVGSRAEDVSKRVQSYLGEAVYGYGCVRDLIAERPNARVLEVGAGIGLLARFLGCSGVDITALEPVGAGFDIVAAISEELTKQLRGTEIETLTIGVEELDPGSHGKFDLIYSINVLEHVPDPEAAIVAMAAVLADGGVMRHSCPNYTFPYEPHLSIPVCSLCPGISEKIFRKTVARKREVWDSVNFITGGRVRRCAKAHGLKVDFEPRQLYSAVARLESDAQFGARHRKGWIRGVAGLLSRSGALHLLKLLPATWATPMLFTVRSRSA